MLEKTWDKGKQDFRLALFGSDDKLAILLKSVSAQQPELSGGISSHTGFWRAQVRYRNKISDDTELRVVAATGQDFVSLSIGSIYFDVTEWPIASRIEIAQKLERNAINDFGLDLLYEPYSVDAQLPVRNPPGQPPPGPILSKPPVATTATGAITPRLLRRPRADALERGAHRPRRAPRLLERHQGLGLRSALARAPGPHDRLPADDAEGRRGRLLRAAATAGHQQGVRAAGGEVGEGERVRHRRRAGDHAATSMSRLTVGTSKRTTSSSPARRTRGRGTPSASRHCSAGDPTRASSGGSRTRSRGA